MSAKVFLSVGSTSNDKQENFVRAMERFLEQNGLTPQTVGRTYFSSKQPLAAIDEVLQALLETLQVPFTRRTCREREQLDGHRRPPVVEQARIHQPRGVQSDPTARGPLDAARFPQPAV